MHTIIASGVGKSKLLRYVCTASSPFFHLEGQVCLWKIRFFPEKMSDFTETPHFNWSEIRNLKKHNKTLRNGLFTRKTGLSNFSSENLKKDFWHQFFIQMVSSGVKGCRQNRHKNKRIIVEIVRLFLCLFFDFTISKKTDNQTKMRRNTKW